jgi:dihydroorotate dehydrogenase electron transfer subunit
MPLSDAISLFAAASYGLMLATAACMTETNGTALGREPGPGDAACRARSIAWHAVRRSAGRSNARFEQVLAPVVFNKHLTGDYWLLEVEAPGIAGRLTPGQFVNIRIEGSLAPYLRRPFSVYRVSPDGRRLQVAYKLLGEGTRLMKSTMPQDGVCDVLGPFGRGFRLPENARRIAVIGRGIGIAALPTLVDEAAKRGTEVHGFLSARTTPNLVALDIFASHGFPVTTHTDEGSTGLVTDHLAAVAEKLEFDAFYVCGSNRLAARSMRWPKEGTLCRGCDGAAYGVRLRRLPRVRRAGQPRTQRTRKPFAKSATTGPSSTPGDRQCRRLSSKS